MCLQTDWQCVWLEELKSHVVYNMYEIILLFSNRYATNGLVWNLGAGFFQSSPDDSNVQPDLRTFTQVSHRGSHAQNEPFF